MKETIQTIKSKLGFFGAIVLAAIIGSLSTSIVKAAIPNSSTGEIESCYRNTASLTLPKGNLRLIDKQASATCTAQETAINWKKDGPLVLKDGNGQILGDIVDYSTDTAQVYNHSLSRIVLLTYNGGVLPGLPIPAYYLSSDCSGQAYFNEGSMIIPKTSLFKIGEGASNFYAKVADNTSSSAVTAYSVLDQTGSCTVIGGWFTSMYSLTTVTLPFSLPLQDPVKF